MKKLKPINREAFIARLERELIAERETRNKLEAELKVLQEDYEDLKTELADAKADLRDAKDERDTALEDCKEAEKRADEAESKVEEDSTDEINSLLEILGVSSHDWALARENPFPKALLQKIGASRP